MANPITTVNPTQTVAPKPSVLQKSGAIISQGATTNANGTLTLLTTSASISPSLRGAAAVTSITQTGGLATVTTTAPHGIITGDVIPVTIAGALPAAYSGTFNVTATGASTFTYPVSAGTSSPATGTITWTLEDVAETMAMNSTFFSQNGIKSVYVLELGEGTAAEGITALTAWIVANPGQIYSYLTPQEWDGASAFVPFLKTFAATNAKTYFFVTTTQANMALYAGIKSVLALVPAPGVALTEFDMAAPFSVTLGYSPSSSQQVPPLQYAFLFGTTAWSPSGTQSTLANFATNNINYVSTGAEGGISNMILQGGNTQDGLPFNFWYSVDWCTINVDLAVSNVVINGSNSVPYLYYNQAGINRLQAAAVNTMRSAISYGLALGTLISTQLPFATFAANVANGLYSGYVAVNAEPFDVYNSENPNDYAIGKYGGLSIAMTPLRGFNQIIVNLNASTFV